jgi:hypothetical protein
MGIINDRYYKKNPDKLRELLPGFACGQVHERTRYGEVYQGSFKTVDVESYRSSYRARIKLFWYCKLKVISNLIEPGEPTIIGDKIDLREDWELVIQFTRFCDQVRKQRIKVFGEDDSIIYFTKRENAINLTVDAYGRYIGPTIRTYVAQLTLPGAFVIR